ncbi:neutral zinc metallopeptidase [Streptomyces virginiae]|uniref:neutral zinc metallopeptidase n=1 Tax=Streptomyces virginiae TaxID=1961 RepID=UPI00225C30E6|nr:neutral zinc metallopeptidase [Streptomyces virginiae]MCX5276829.1 neutral zinc metallopeptidase [Streptomyces virginiae]
MNRLAAALAAGALAVGVAVTGCGPAAFPQVVAEQTDPSDSPDFNGDLTDESVPVAPQGAAVPQSNPDTSNPQTVESYLTDIVADAHKVWADYFKRLGLEEPRVTYTIISPGHAPVESRCANPGEPPLVVSTDTKNAFYCPADEREAGFRGAIYLPVITMQQMWTGTVLGQPSKQGGDFAAAIITAHEFGHHIVDELRLQYQAKGFTYPEPTAPWDELIADCMAGVWAASAYQSGYLDASDFAEAEAALEAIGDAPGDPGDHGTPEQRVQALRTGYFGTGEYGPAEPFACTSTYWK